MKKRIFSRLMAMVMAVALLSTTGFAAVALDQNLHIDSTTGALLSHKETNENEEEFDSYDYYLASDVILDKTLKIGKNVDASIDLNGHTLYLNEDLKITRDEESGKISCENSEKRGSVIRVTDGGHLSVTDTDEFGGNEGKTGTISGGAESTFWGGQGGGVLVTKPGSSFTMTGGAITNNYSYGHGGAVGSNLGGDIALDGVTISGNATSGAGSAFQLATVGSKDDATIVVKNSLISGNYGENSVFNVSSKKQAAGNKLGLTIENCIIKDNINRISAGAVIRIDDGDDTGLTSVTVDELSSICNNIANGQPATLIWGGKNSTSTDNRHVWGEVIVDTAATCHSTGIGHKECKSYDSEKDEGKETPCRENNIVISIDPTNHDGGTEVRGAKEPTCTEPGYTGDTYCLGCNGLIEEGEPIPAKGHGEGVWTVTTPAQPGIPGVESLICPDCGEVLDTRPIPALPMPIDFGDSFTGGDTGTTIADEATPLAGLFTRADAIGYLWEQSGSPEAELSTFADVPEDHYWAVAIGWAEDNGIALPDEEDSFRPDDLVLRTSNEPEGELQEFLNRYAVFAGLELDEGELFFVLDGAADDIIMGEDAQVIFDAFFAKLETALAGQEKAA